MALEFWKARVLSTLWPALESLGVKTTLSYPDWFGVPIALLQNLLKSSSWTVLALPQSQAAGWLQNSRGVCQWRAGVNRGRRLLSLAWGGTLVAVCCFRNAHSSVFSRESLLRSNLQFIRKILFEVSRSFVRLWGTHIHTLGFLASNLVGTLLVTV